MSSGLYDETCTNLVASTLANMTIEAASEMIVDCNFVKSGKLPFHLAQYLVDSMLQGALLPRTLVQAIVDSTIQQYDEKRETLIRIDLYDFQKDIFRDMTIVGDLHGQLYDLDNILRDKAPSYTQPYLFLGDFVDRGLFGLETFLAVLLHRLVDPMAVYLLRGNHEVRRKGEFRKQVDELYDGRMYDEITEIFQWLPYAAVIDDEIFAVHGGIPLNRNSLADMKRQLKVGGEEDYYNDHEYTWNFLWNDPEEGSNDGAKPHRFKTWGSRTTEKFLQTNNLQLIVRSHEYDSDGYFWSHNDTVLTIFSAPKYLGYHGNDGVVLRLTSVDNRNLTFFEGTDIPQHARNLPKNQSSKS